MDISIQWLGFAGIALSAIAYLPQIHHLIKERCTLGLSVGAYIIWTLASIIFITYAFSRWDLVFIILYFYQLITTTIILFYSIKYKGQLCEEHGGKPLYTNN